jgi:hypothetical protein
MLKFLVVSPVSVIQHFAILALLLNEGWGSKLSAKSMSTDSGKFVSNRRAVDTQVILVFDSRRTQDFTHCLDMLGSLRSKMSKSIHFQSIDLASVSPKKKSFGPTPNVKSLPKISLDSESQKLRIKDSELFSHNNLISSKLLPIISIGREPESQTKGGNQEHRETGTEVSPTVPVKLDGSIQKAFSITSQLKDSHLTKAFNKIFSNFTSNNQNTKISERKSLEEGVLWSEEPRQETGQQCQWLLRVNGHSIPFNEKNYSWEDLWGWLNKRVHRHPYRIKSTNHFYSVSNQYFAAIYIVHLDRSLPRLKFRLLKDRILKDLRALAAEFPYTDFYYSIEKDITRDLKIKPGHSLLLIRQFEDGHKKFYQESEISFNEMKNAILKYSFPFIMLWNRRVLDFVLEEKQDTAFLIIRKRDNFHLEAAFERVALLFPHPKVRFAVIPVGNNLSPSKQKMLTLLGINPDSKLPAIYGLFFENEHSVSRTPNTLPGTPSKPTHLTKTKKDLHSKNKALSPNNQKQGEVPKEFDEVSKEVLTILNKFSFPKIKVIKCENMTEKGIKSFLGSMNDLGSFAHCKQNQFISHKKNLRVVTFLNLDSLSSVLERSVHFERWVLVYHSQSFSEHSVLTHFSKLIKKFKSTQTPSTKHRGRRRRKDKWGGSKKQENTNKKDSDSKDKSTERQYYIFDKSRNEWPPELSNLKGNSFYVLRIRVGSLNQNLIQFVGFDSLADLDRVLDPQDLSFEQTKSNIPLRI